MATKLFNIRMPSWIEGELLKRVQRQKDSGIRNANKTRYILEAIEEKFAREDRKKSSNKS